ncbi:MAG: aldehyde dehydrogenase family protein [Pseudomonadota bacterium]
MLDRRLFYINGEWCAPDKAHDFDVINPSDESVCAVISLGDQADTDKAVKAAKEAFKSWAFSSKSERVELVEAILKHYIANQDEMAEMISLEMGAPIDMARAQQVQAGSGHIRNFLNSVRDFEFERVLSDTHQDTRILYQPVGVCGLITPWNWPMNQVCLKVIPAILAGCAMVLKPSEIAPLSSLTFAKIIAESGAPKGLFNLINGDGAGVGTQLSGHPDIDMISFTGSTRAGTAISQNAAKTLKRVHLELGGKGANIIFSDADQQAVRRNVLHCFNNSGQSCNAPTRMLVQRPLYDEAVQIAKQLAEQAKTGPANQPGSHYGPVVSETQFNKIQTLIQKGIDEGAKLVAGGAGKPENTNQGYYVRPTIFADVRNDMTIAREEIFGPVLSIIPFDSEDEAVEIANDTIYGLTNYVQSGDAQKRHRVAKKLRSGMVEMNGKSRGPGSPFGGMKASGNGREGGVWGIEDFLEIQSVSGWQD